MFSVRNVGVQKKHLLVQFSALSFRKESVGGTANVEAGVKVTELALEVECSFGSCWQTLLGSDNV